MKQIFFLLIILVSLSSCCKDEVFSEPQMHPYASYKSGIIIDQRSGEKTFALSFESTAPIQEIRFTGTWEFFLPQGKAFLDLTEKDFTWERKANKMMGIPNINLSNYLAQPGVAHQVKSLRYQLMIDGRWWNYSN